MGVRADIVATAKATVGHIIRYITGQGATEEMPNRQYLDFAGNCTVNDDGEGIKVTIPDVPAGSVQVGQVETLRPGSMAYVTNTGTPIHSILNFGIPRGDAGPEVEKLWEAVEKLDDEAVHKEGDEIIAGTKTFVSSIDASGGVIGDVEGNISGNAGTATKLATARSLQTDLSSTTPVTFDGSADQDAIPVTGVLPIANGGTGSDTQNFVDLTTAQTVAGVKTFTSSPEAPEPTASDDSSKIATTEWVHDATFVATGTTTGRTLENRFADVINVKDFGAKGDGVTDDTAAIQAWLTYLMQTGKKGTAAEGIYYMASPLTIELGGDIDVACSKKAVFKGGEDINQVMILLYSEAQDSYQVSWKGGTFDVSDCLFSESTLSGSGLGLQKVWKSIVDSVYFYGGESYDVEGEHGGDTGLGIIDCKYVTVTNCYFTGFRDLGIYATGDSNTSAGVGDGEDLIISNNQFIKCAGGLALKRQTKRAIISNNTFAWCYRGVYFAQVGIASSSSIPGHSSIIIGNMFSHIAKHAIFATYTKSILISSNRIQDVGYELDGTTPITNTMGILLEGSTDSLITENLIKNDEWAITNGSCVGIMMQAFTYDSVSYSSEYNVVLNNYITCFDIGIRETPGQAGYNKYDGNLFKSVTDEYNNIQSTSEVYYLTGTWTVKFYDASSGGNESATTTTGYYTKNGNQVTIHFSVSDIDTTGMTGVNGFYIGLPFRANSNCGAAGSILVDTVTFETGRNAPVLIVSPNASRAAIGVSGNGVGDKIVLVSNISSGVSDISLASLTYTI